MITMRRMLGGMRRRLRVRRPRPSILMYHRVVALQHDPWGLAVDPAIFDEQMRYLREHRIPMTVDEMVQRLKRGTLPAKAVGVTFDDAYLDNLVNGKPALVQHNVPGTVFVPTGYIGRKVLFWWDELSAMILDCPHPHTSVQVCGEDKVPITWQVSEAKDGDPEWRGWQIPQTKRQAAYVALWSRMQKMSEAEREPVLQALRQQFPINADPLGMPMEKRQIDELVDGGLIRLGAHTVHHASLSDASLQVSREEIQESKRQCEALTPDAVQGFAYPYGNMTSAVCREVAAAGFAYGCAAEAGFLDRQDQDLFTLPRVPAPNIAGRAFGALLTG